LVNKNPGVAAVLSFLIPGLGQIYNGNFGSGLFHLIVNGIGFWILFASFFFLGIGIILINAGFACYHAYYDAADFNAKLQNSSTSTGNQEAFAWNNSHNYKKPSSPLLWIALLAASPFLIIWFLAVALK